MSLKKMIKGELGVNADGTNKTQGDLMAAQKGMSKDEYSAYLAGDEGETPEFIGEKKTYSMGGEDYTYQETNPAFTAQRKNKQEFDKALNAGMDAVGLSMNHGVTVEEAEQAIADIAEAKDSAEVRISPLFKDYSSDELGTLSLDLTKNYTANKGQIDLIGKELKARGV